MASTGETLAERFETQPNALNALRLALAASVVVWHSYSLPGRTGLPGPVMTLLEQGAVDAFFAISGFLIVRSWQRRPILRDYLTARSLRLFPALFVCLTLTALVAPAATVAERFGYIGMGTTTLGTFHLWAVDTAPVAANGYQWNLSLWSLPWELGCYLVVALLGACGVVSRRTWLMIGGSAWLLAVSWSLAGVPADLAMGAWPLPRMLLMFSAGALLWLYADQVVLRPRYAVAAASIILVGAFGPDYRLVAAPAVAYLCLFLGLWLGRDRRLVLGNDFSYGLYIYGAPVQQALLLSGFVSSWLVFSVVSLAIALALAVASWFLIERPALGLRRGARRATVRHAAAQVTV